jgi:hypothetical protein
MNDEGKRPAHPCETWREPSVASDPSSPASSFILHPFPNPPLPHHAKSVSPTPAIFHLPSSILHPHVEPLGLEPTIVLIVRPDPKPLRLVAMNHGKRAKIIADSGGPIPADFLEMKGRMMRVAQPELEAFARESANRLRKLAQPLTKAWGRRGPRRRRGLAGGRRTGEIESDLWLTALLFHHPRIQTIQFATSGIVFDLAIPLRGVAFVHSTQQLAKRLVRKFRDGCFDLGRRAHRSILA